MPDDNTGKVNSETKTSDEELSNAYRETFGEEAGDTPELLEAAKKKLADVKELQKKGAYTAAEGSRLGREIKSLKTTINEMQQTLKTLVESRTISSISSSEEFPSYISTVDDLKKWRKSEKKELKNAEVKYGQTYIGLVKEMMKEDEDIDESSQKEVWDLLSGQGSAFNIRRGDIDDPDTWNPVIDAEINYAKAKGHLFKTKATKLRPNVKGERGVSTNLSISSHSDSVSTEEIELDDFAKDFVGRTGMSKESQKTALKEDTPIHLRGKF